MTLKFSKVMSKHLLLVLVKRLMKLNFITTHLTIFIHISLTLVLISMKKKEEHPKQHFTLNIPNANSQIIIKNRELLIKLKTLKSHTMDAHLKTTKHQKHLVHFISTRIKISKLRIVNSKLIQLLINHREHQELIQVKEEAYLLNEVKLQFQEAHFQKTIVVKVWPFILRIMKDVLLLMITANSSTILISNKSKTNNMLLNHVVKTLIYQILNS